MRSREEPTIAHDTTIRDVAVAAGVSIGTVSNVLNHPDRVASATRDRVEAVIRSLDYVPHSSARQLARGTGRVLGLVVLDLANPFFTEVAIGAEEAASAAGYAVFLCNSANDGEREASNVRVLEEQRVAGVLYSPIGDDAPVLRRLRAAGVPVVLVDREGLADELCSVAVDDVEGGRLAAEHLVAVGAEQFVFLAGPAGVRQHEDRRLGVDAHLRAIGRPASARVLHSAVMNIAAGESHAEEVARLAETGGRVGVAAGNDLLAIGLLNGLAARGVAVPDRVCVVGYDDIEMAALVAIPLTSVRQPMHALGHRAARLLIEEVERDPDHRHGPVRFTPTLVPRASTLG